MTGSGENGERRERIKSILERVAGLPPSAREEVLGEACAGDGSLRAEVESLLVHAEAPGTADAETWEGIEVGDSATIRIPGYRVVRQLGEGGMGVVYRAVQETPRRVVALKVIRPHIVGPNTIRRFRIEAETLGRLQHPGIAQLYEVGIADMGEGEQPFFAMEYVKGRTLLDHARVAELSGRDRLRLMTRIIDAVQHAHSRGVVHRDLKPGNILVTEEGQPKILDFGVARTTGLDMQVTTMLTDVGQLVGTIPYMSPEQVDGDPDEIDARSDVYALGVVLYELLAGRLPYDLRKKAVYEAIRVIREQEPSSLGEIDRSFRGDIETIIGKSLQKVPERRYASASELGSDIQRYLEDEPISARPPSAVYKIGKFARRHRATTAVIAASAAGLVIAAAGASYGYVSATRSAERERIAREDADANLLIAENRLDQLGRVTDVVQAFEERIDRRSGGTLARRIFAETVSDALRGVLDEVGDDPVMRRRIAEASLSAGRLALEAGTTADADENLLLADRLASELLMGGENDAGLRLLRAEAMVGRARVLDRAGDPSGAVALLADARDQAAAAGDTPEAGRVLARIEVERAELFAGLVGRAADTEATLRRAATMWDGIASGSGPTNGDVEQAARTRRRLAEWLSRENRLDESAGVLDPVITGLRAAGEKTPADQGIALALADALGARARNEHFRLRPDDPGHAEGPYRERHAILERLHYEDPWSDEIYSRLVGSFRDVGDLLTQTGRPEEAREWIDTFGAAARRALATDPTNLRRRRAVASAGRALAELLQRSDPAGAIEACDDAITICRELVRLAPESAEYKIDLSLVEFVKGYALFQQYRLADESARLALGERILASTEPAAERLLALHAGGSLAEREKPYLARSLRNAARFVSDAGEPARGLEWFMKADELEPREEWWLRRHLALLAHRAGESEIAESAAMEAYQLLMSEVGEARDRGERRLRETFGQLGLAWPGETGSGP